MPSLRRADAIEIGVPFALALSAAMALLLPEGSGLRFALALPVLFFVPGHLLISAVTNAPRRIAQRWTRALVALGVSPPIVGLLALSTVLLPGGFRSTSIVAVVTLASLFCAGVALWRRRRVPVLDVKTGPVAA